MLIALSFLLLIATFYVMLPCGSILFAQSGCCKRRDVFKCTSGIVFHYPLTRASRSNDQTDRDNVFDQARINLVGLEL